MPALGAATPAYSTPPPFPRGEEPRPPPTGLPSPPSWAAHTPDTVGCPRRPPRGPARHYPVLSQPDAPPPGLAPPSLTRVSLSGHGPSRTRGPVFVGCRRRAFASGAGRRVPAAARGPHDRCPRGSLANLGTLGASEGEAGRGRLLGSQTRASSRYGRKAGPPGSPRAPRRESPGVPRAGPSSAGRRPMEGAGARAASGSLDPAPRLAPPGRDEGNP